MTDIYRPRHAMTDAEQYDLDCWRELFGCTPIPARRALEAE